MQEFLANSAEETQEIGFQIGKALKKGDIVLLKGDMGAGKTTITHGIVKGLGSDDFVSSPTFALVNTYYGKDFEIDHFDLYRLTDEDDLYSIGFEDFLEEDSKILLIEWSQLAERLLPQDVITVLLKATDDNTRKIAVEGIEIPKTL